jgi:homogentisate 1,2-dioxygenase
MFYVARGRIPHKRHTQHRARDGSLYAEELFGVDGFSGRSSLLYHVLPPTQTHRIEPLGPVVLEEADDGVHRHRLMDTASIAEKGDAITGRIPLFFNADVTVGVVRPAEPMPDTLFYRNAEADELLFIHEGKGVFESVFGPLRYGSGDSIVIPVGTTWRLAPEAGSPQRHLWLECPSAIEPPRRYRNDYGQLLEHSPYSQRDIRVPKAVPPRREEGEFRIHVKARGRRTAYHSTSHPFDLVGWDGYLWPYILDIGDFEPITGRIHQPSPAHQALQARGVVVSAFVPRRLAYHPLAIPAPYHHSNIDNDELTYYLAGTFSSGRGVDVSSFTLHPAGIPHGPHPGTVEASLGQDATDELAVMVETAQPLRITKQAAGLDDPTYPFSWLMTPEAPGEAEAPAERGPEAYPG